MEYVLFILSLLFAAYYVLGAKTSAFDYSAKTKVIIMTVAGAYLFLILEGRHCLDVFYIPYEAMACVHPNRGYRSWSLPTSLVPCYAAIIGIALDFMVSALEKIKPDNED